MLLTSAVDVCPCFACGWWADADWFPGAAGAGGIPAVACVCCGVCRAGAVTEGSISDPAGDCRAAVELSAGDAANWA